MKSLLDEQILAQAIPARLGTCGFSQEIRRRPGHKTINRIQLLVKNILYRQLRHSLLPLKEIFA
ncbi:MAG: hypothetical protein IPQ02_07210 [Saprospiraceae bacterium]|nr:hypothetical protein [Candidatus Defluviibacterium haderslevense]